MVVEQLSDQLAGRVAGRQQRISQRRAIGILRFRLARRQRLGRGDLARLGLTFEQPVAQQPCRDHVLLVVGRDRGEQLWVACLDPPLVLDDRRAAVLDLRVPLEREERLHLFQPVAGNGRDEPAAHHLEQVDQYLATQQLVNLLLARAVAAREAAQHAQLIGGVVVDVHTRVLLQTRVNEINELLERRPLARAIMRP